jgi:tRNA (guanine9-N1)-methyltransferase
MEPEERPAKRLKLENGEEVENAAFADAPVHFTSGAERIAAADEQLPANTNFEQEIETPNGTAPKNSDGEDAVPKLSKNQLKKQRRIEKWEAGREDRKVKRREKLKAKRHRKRDEWAQTHPSEDEDGDTDVATLTTNGAGVVNVPKTKKLSATRPPKYPDGTQLPVTFLFDCDFNDLMYESELKSLGVQITRSYSDNRKSQFHAHMAMSSFGGRLQERFDGILAKQYTSWKNFPFFSENFVQVSEKAKIWMKGEQGGMIAGALNQEDGEEGEVVYLSAESDVTLERLKPNSTYIIGVLVDKNRHKGICYKRAMDKGIKTAKLPIGEFLQMKSRKVLATNHVIEIMLKWLECGDWGKAFLEVIPARKGGVLKTKVQEGSQLDEEESGDEDDSEKDTAANEENGSTADKQARIGEGFIAAANPDSNAPPLTKDITE